MRPTSVLVKREHFEWLIEELCLLPSAWPLLSWLAEHAVPEGHALRLSPPDGDFEPFLGALAAAEREIAGYEGLVRLYHEVLAHEADETPPQVEAVAGAMEAALNALMERADRVDILRNIVFYQVGPDFPEDQAPGRAQTETA